MTTYRPEFEANAAVAGEDQRRQGSERILLSLHPDADLDYLERRIRAESFGDHGIEDIKGG